MSDPSDSDPSGSGDTAREAAKEIADQVAPLLKRARARGFDFLAYLPAMDGAQGIAAVVRRWAVSASLEPETGAVRLDIEA